ncbi:NusG domain II-containing protein [Muricomes intestini]|uniref:NusG domain II-containing protein n=1 Tax=Muricomes intestini TaxID=1796634 RepID=UPI002FE09427
MIKKNDLILAGTVLIVALAAVLFITFTKKEGAEVVVTVDGEVYKTMPLDKDAALTLGEKQGNYNVVEVKGGEVTMTEANCRDQICVNHKAIHYNHESIVCLPHKVTVEIRGGEEGDIDIMAN